MELPDLQLRGDLKVIPFRKSHAQFIEINKKERYYESIMPNYRDFVATNAQQGQSWTFVNGDLLLCCFGIRTINSGVGDVWMFAGEYLPRHAVSLVRSSRILYDDMIENKGFYRLQIVVDCNNDSAYQFAKAIGFQVEGIMRKVGLDKANHFLMSRIET
jgi:hypothetical protein